MYPFFIVVSERNVHVQEVNDSHFFVGIQIETAFRKRRGPVEARDAFTWTGGCALSHKGPHIYL